MVSYSVLIGIIIFSVTCVLSAFLLGYDKGWRECDVYHAICFKKAIRNTIKELRKMQNDNDIQV